MGGWPGSGSGLCNRHRDGASGHKKLVRETLQLQGKMPVPIKPT